MTIRELYFLLSAFGFGVLFTLSVSTLKNRGWRFPYAWFAVATFYMALIAFVMSPIFDDFFYNTRGLFILQHYLTALLAPLIMTAFARISEAIQKITIPTLLIIWLPFLLTLTSYYFLDSQVVNVVCYGLVVVSSVFWANRIWVRVRDYMRSLQNYVEDINVYDISWMKFASVVVSIATIISWGVLVFVSPVSSPSSKPALVSLVLIYCPLAFFLSFMYDKGERYHNFNIKDAPAGELTDNLFELSRTVEKKREVQMKAKKGKKYNNSILASADATAKVVDMDQEGVSKWDSSQPQSSSDAGEVDSETIEKLLNGLESEHGSFFLNKDLSAAHLAKQLKIQRADLSAYFHDKGTTFFDYVERIRVVQSAQMIAKMPDISIDQICYQCGFISKSDFTRSFTSYYHISPNDYRKNISNS